MTSNVDDAITESVTQANVKKGSEAPAMAIDPHQARVRRWMRKP